MGGCTISAPASTTAVAEAHSVQLCMRGADGVDFFGHDFQVVDLHFLFHSMTRWITCMTPF